MSHHNIAELCFSGYWIQFHTYLFIALLWFWASQVLRNALNIISKLMLCVTEKENTVCVLFYESILQQIKKRKSKRKVVASFSKKQVG